MSLSPLGTFPKIHPFWYRHPSVRAGCMHQGNGQYGQSRVAWLLQCLHLFFIAPYQPLPISQKHSPPRIKGNNQWMASLKTFGGSYRFFFQVTSSVQYHNEKRPTGQQEVLSYEILHVKECLATSMDCFILILNRAGPVQKQHVKRPHLFCEDLQHELPP